MLRKDVKLGFAIGGIMLAVVIVYVLVVPGDKKTVGVVTDDSQTTGKTDVTPAPLPVDGKTAEPETADKSNAPPVDPTKAVAAVPPATMPSALSSNSGGPDWNKLLAEGSSSPAMMSETPTLDARHPAVGADSSATAAAEKPADQAVASGIAVTPTTPLGEKTPPDLSIDTASGTATDTATTPATQPAGSGQRMHVVASGEMLTSIAAAAYGDSHKWKRIAEANPNINPNRLAPGTKLVIPALKSSSDTGAVLASARLDSQTQYEVQPNDSLYRISMKLYGKADHVDKLYDANKEMIGSDPKRLKLHMVLKLTDPPSNTSGNTSGSSPADTAAR